MTQCCNSLCLSPCRQKDPAIGEANGAGGQKEGKHRCHQGEGKGHTQAALKGRQLKVGVWVLFLLEGADVTKADLRNL